jgi:hypothetical protein
VVAGILETKRRTIETVELERRLAALEQSMERMANDLEWRLAGLEEGERRSSGWSEAYLSIVAPLAD